ncbi:MAG TPA: hypothetical protein VGE07_31310 [Herpetosiphonaceae bacterium]
MRPKKINYTPEELATLTLLGNVAEARQDVERASTWKFALASLSIADALRRQTGYGAEVRALTRDAYAALPRARYRSQSLYSTDFGRMLSLTYLHDPTTVARIDDFIAQLATRQDRFDAEIRLALALEGAEPRSQLIRRLAPLRQLLENSDLPGRLAAMGGTLAIAYGSLGERTAAAALLDELLAEILASPHEFQRFAAYLQIIRTWEQLGDAKQAEALRENLERVELGAIAREKKLYVLASARIKAGRDKQAERMIDDIREIAGYDEQGWIQVIEAYASQGQPEAAQALLEQVGKYMGGQHGRAQMTVAIAYASARDYARARAIQDSVPSVSGGLHPQFHQTIAITGLRHGDHNEAQAAIRRLAAGWPLLLTPVMDQRIAQGDWDGAEAMALMPERPAQRTTLLRYLAGLLIANHRHAEAVGAWLASQRQG